MCNTLLCDMWHILYLQSIFKYNSWPSLFDALEWIHFLKKQSYKMQFNLHLVDAQNVLSWFLYIFLMNIIMTHFEHVFMLCNMR